VLSSATGWRNSDVPCPRSQGKFHTAFYRPACLCTLLMSVSLYICLLFHVCLSVCPCMDCLRPSINLSTVICLSIRLLTAHKYEYFRPANEENQANLSPLIHKQIPKMPCANCKKMLKKKLLLTTSGFITEIFFNLIHS
jgi:hypothetical protein